MSFSKVPFDFISSIPKKNHRYSKYEAAGSWYADIFSNRVFSVSGYARMWGVKYDTAHTWVKDFCAHADMKVTGKSLENEGVETGKLLEKINQLEQQLTDIKSEPLENHWKIGGERLDNTIRVDKKRKEKPKTTPTPSPSLPGIEPDSKPAPGDNLTLPEWLPLEAWAGYLEMRTKKKAPNTKRALQGAINNLDKLRKEGDDPGAVLDQSTFRAWVGLFQLPADVRAARKAEADKIREDAIVEREMAKIHAARTGKGPLPGIKPVSAEEVFDGWIEEGDDD